MLVFPLLELAGEDRADVVVEIFLIKRDRITACDRPHFWRFKNAPRIVVVTVPGSESLELPRVLGGFGH